MRLGIFGATGRLGKMLGACAMQDPFWTLTSATGRSSIGADYGSFLGLGPSGLLIAQAPSTPLPDLFIDVSLPANLREKLSYARPMVIGTTGLTEEDKGLLREASSSIPLFYSANFSLGMAILQKITAEVSRLFSQDAHIDVIETHHAGKKDAPSGSALYLASAAQTCRPRQEKVPIHSLRSGQIVGEHTVQFNSADERIVLSHQVHSRKAFALGALAAARFILDKPPGLYGMDALLQSS